MTDIPFHFQTSGFQLLPMPDEYLHITTNYPLTPAEEHQVDDQGVTIMLGQDRYEYGPVFSLVVLMARLYRYQTGGEGADLHAAVRNAEHLITTGIRVEGAVYYPYTLPWNLHMFRDQPMEVPWFSGMAQGYALMALTRLYRQTGEQRYLDEAHQVFASFLQLRGERPEWITDLLDGDYVWFEEYPRNNGPSDRTYNGHLYAVYGLYEYFLLTRDERAHTLADGGLTTMLHLLDTWRAPGQISWYCLSHRERAASYHGSHCAQLAYCYAMTGAPVWAQLAEVFIRDWPATVQASADTGPLVVQPGTHTVGRAAAYDIEERLEVQVDEPLELAWDFRRNERTELRTYISSTDERYRHVLFREEPGIAYVQGEVDALRWPHTLKLNPVVASPRWYRMVNGELAQHTPDGEIPLHAVGRAAINGMHAFQVQDTTGQVWWIPRDDIEIAGIQETQ